MFQLFYAFVGFMDKIIDLILKTGMSRKQCSILVVNSRISFKFGKEMLFLFWSFICQTVFDCVLYLLSFESFLRNLGGHVRGMSTDCIQLALPLASRPAIFDRVTPLITLSLKVHLASLVWVSKISIATDYFACNLLHLSLTCIRMREQDLRESLTLP